MAPKKQPIQQWVEGHVTWVCNEPHPRHHLFLKTDACSGRVYMKNPPQEFTAHARIRFVLVGPDAKGRYSAEQGSLVSAADDRELLEERLRDVTEERDKLEDRAKSLRKELDRRSATITELKTDVAGKDTLIGQLQERRDAFKEELGKSKTEVQRIQLQLAHAQSDVRKLQEQRDQVSQKAEAEVRKLQLQLDQAKVKLQELDVARKEAESAAEDLKAREKVLRQETQTQVGSCMTLLKQSMASLFSAWKSDLVAMKSGVGQQSIEAAAAAITHLEQHDQQTTESAAHASRSMAELLLSGLFMPRQLSLQQRGSMIGYVYFQMSPVLGVTGKGLAEARAPVLQRFLQGLGAPSVIQDIFGALSWLNQQRGSGFEVMIGYHGTDSGAATKILQDGFDPSKRKGQQYGPGEYFDFDFQHSPRFANQSGPGAIIVTLIAVPKPVAASALRVTDTMIIVNNPADGKTTYCLPLGLLTPKPAPPTATAATGATVYYEDASRGGWLPFDATANAKVLPWLQTAAVGSSMKYTVGSQTYSATVTPALLQAEQRNEQTGVVRRLRIQ
jgi:hypothetical protein